MNFAPAILLLAPFAAAFQDPDAGALRPADQRKIARLATSIGRARDSRDLAKNMADVLSVTEKAAGSDHAQAWIRSQILPALKELRDKSLKAARARASRVQKPFQVLTRLRKELDRRREAALKLIFDESVYLREDHPDWPKGDRANGQLKVDRLVLKRTRGSVEEFWISAGRSGLRASVHRSM